MKKIFYLISTLAFANITLTSCPGHDPDKQVTPTATTTSELLTDFDGHGRFASCYKFGSQTTSDSARNPAVTAPLAKSGTGFWRLSGTCNAGAYYLDGFGGTDGTGLNLDMNDSIAFWVNTEANSASYVQLQVVDTESKTATTVGTTSCPAIDGEGFVYKIVLPATNGWVRKSIAISDLTSDPYQVTGDDASHSCWGQLDHVFTPNAAACQKIGFTTGDAGTGVAVEANIDDISIIRVP